MTGLKDDIVGLSPLIKFVAQFTSAFIVAMVANLRIADLHGIIGVNEMPYYASITLTVFFIVGIVNAFNLIDGIDGLAGSLGVIFSLLYAYMFYRAGEMGWSYLSLSLTGALIGFLFFNVTPAKIFMGDSGSLVLGFVAAVLSIKFMGVSAKSDIMVGTTHITSVAGLVVSILIIPIFDTLRVFTLRILRNTSPFTADSNHLHHRLLFLGLSHVQATLVLAVVNVMFIVMALSLQNLDNTQLVSLLMLTILGINGGLSLYIEQYKKSLFATKTKTVSAKIDIADTLSQPKKSFGEEILEKISEN
jgi:UDP-N-acetylmuramyl pentapeptide phosphotransferase/UDP-N-acetylglucosamine-1-phosphate transferase